MADVFLSYAHADSEIAEQISESLKRAGLSVWSSSEINLGESWGNMIRSGLEQSAVVVALITSRSAQSEYCAQEVEFAIASEKKIFPVVLQEGGGISADMPSALEQYQFFQISLSDRHSLSALAQGVQRFIERVAVHPDSPVDPETVEDADVSDATENQPQTAGRVIPTIWQHLKTIAQRSAHGLHRALARGLPRRTVRWLRRLSWTIGLAGAALASLFLAEPYFQAEPTRPTVADLVFVDGIERKAVIESAGRVRVVDGDQTIGVMRGHPTEVVHASFKADGQIIRTIDSHGRARETKISTLQHLSWPERDAVTLGGTAHGVWRTTAAPLLATIRQGWRWSECKIGIGKWCPLSRFRDPFPAEVLAPEMIVIPSGSFQMGTPDGNEFEGPTRIVTVPNFAMSRTEVTVGAFRRFVEATGHDMSGRCLTGGTWEQPGIEQSEDHPVVCVNWQDAQAYISWLNGLQAGLTYRLPSEAEWEYAARAGTTTAYWTGDEIDKTSARFNAAGTLTVGSLKENPFGLADVHGNVWEWVEDCWHEDYSGARNDARAWMHADNGNCDMAVLRGGSWVNSAEELRSANRSRDWRGGSYDGIGFRLARTLPDG